MLLFLAIILPIIFAIFIPIAYRSIKSIHTGWFVLIAPLLLFLFYLRFLTPVRQGEAQLATVSWVPSLDFNFDIHIDGLSLLFSLLITGIGSLVVLYSIFYLDKTKEKLGNFYVYLLLFMSAMLGVVQFDHMIALYFFWELTSISSFLLIAYWYKRDASRFGALKSMMITVSGGLMMLVGFISLYTLTGTYSIRETIAQVDTIVDAPLFTVAVVLVLLGAFTKSAQFPFYIWLPDAMEAPTPVSAYLHSATMVKAGLYLVARFTPIFAFSDVWVWLVTGIGLLTLFWGSFFALKQTDLKGILAFSTVSQLGLIMSLLGLGGFAYLVTGDAVETFTFATFAAIFHLFNHATFKGSLFMVAGIVDHETGTRDIRKLGGLMSLMPVTFTVAMIGSLSMAGLPPFNGFLSKEMFLDAVLGLLHADVTVTSVAYLVPVVAWVASVFTFIYSIYFVWYTFMGTRKEEQLPKVPHEAPIGMLISPIVLASLVVLVFFIPNVIGDWLVKPATAAIQSTTYSTAADIEFYIKAWHGWYAPALWLTVGIVVIGFLLFKFLPKWQHLYAKWPEKFTLNRGYDTLMAGSLNWNRALSDRFMTGSVRDYLVYMFAGMAILGITTLFTQGGFLISTDNLAPIRIFEIILAIILVGSVMAILITWSRLTAVIALGGVGYTVALFYVIFKAPDLALTQLVIETISVALFLTAFYHLPKLDKYYKGKEDNRFRFGNFLISVAVGLTVTLIGISAYSQRQMTSISEYYKETVYTEAGGGNIVNVILVDYRGFDTLFEIGVLMIASIGIISMITLRLQKKKKGAVSNEVE